MRLAASNIAWEPSEDDAVAAILREHGFTGVEVAPTKRWPSPLDATKQEIATYRAEWEQRGLKIVAMQALLFGRPDLQLFESSTSRRALRDYLSAIIELGHGLGVHAFVFGSPKNRKRGDMPLDEAMDIATEFFRDVGSLAASRGTVICIEPNPPEYDCDFITTTAEAIDLCERIDSPGIRLNCDMGAIAMNGDDVAATVTAAMPWAGHFHVSEPRLAEVGDDERHVAAARALGVAGYGGWASVEMRAAGEQSAGARVEAVSRAVERVQRMYGELR